MGIETNFDTGSVDQFDEFCKLVDEGQITLVTAQDLYSHAMATEKAWQAWRIALMIKSHNGNKQLAEIYQSNPKEWDDNEQVALDQQGNPSLR